MISTMDVVQIFKRNIFTCFVPNFVNKQREDDSDSFITISEGIIRVLSATPAGEWMVLT